MEDDKVTAVTTLRRRPTIAELLEQYGCGPVRFTGTDDALYERHLMFDNVVAAAAIGPRERFEAVARSVRDVLSQRWLRTEETVRAREPQAGLLPFHGVPDWAFNVEQHHKPSS